MTLVVPPPEWVTLPEAVQMLSPPLEAGAVRRALEAALGDGRLTDRPTPLIGATVAAFLESTAEEELIGAPQHVRDAVYQILPPSKDDMEYANYLAWAANPQSTGSGAWRRWVSEGRIDWDTGIIQIERHDRIICQFRPEISRQKVIDLFRDEQTDTPTPARVGRPPGRSFAAQDQILIQRMHEMFASGDQPSPTAAAKVLVGNDGNGAVGNGTIESKVKRLVRGYLAKQGD